MSIFVILALFSNNEIGLVSGTSFVMLSVMLEDHGNYAEMFMYVFAGAVAIAMFRDLKENSEIIRISDFYFHCDASCASCSF